MLFYENRLLADDSHVISYLIFVENGKDVAKFVVCCNHVWALEGLKWISMQKNDPNISCGSRFVSIFTNWPRPVRLMLRKL